MHRGGAKEPARAPVRHRVRARLWGRALREAHPRAAAGRHHRGHHREPLRRSDAVAGGASVTSSALRGAPERSVRAGLRPRAEPGSGSKRSTFFFLVAARGHLPEALLPGSLPPGTPGRFVPGARGVSASGVQGGSLDVCGARLVLRWVDQKASQPRSPITTLLQ